MTCGVCGAKISLELYLRISHSRGHHAKGIHIAYSALTCPRILLLVRTLIANNLYRKYNSSKDLYIQRLVCNFVANYL